MSGSGLLRTFSRGDGGGEFIIHRTYVPHKGKEIVQSKLAGEMKNLGVLVGPN